MILLTGFEPFGGESTNPSWTAAREAVVLLEQAGYQAAAVEVPCEFGRSIEVLRSAVDGPAAYFPTLPIKACREAVEQQGVPVEVSQTAGTYVCDHIFYGLMRLLENHDGVRGGFIHVPFSTQQAAEHGAPGLPIASMARALATIATTTTAATGHDLQITGGAEH